MEYQVFVYTADKCGGCDRLIGMLRDLALKYTLRSVRALIEPDEGWNTVKHLMCHASRWHALLPEEQATPFLVIHSVRNSGETVSSYTHDKAEAAVSALAEEVGR